ncbi:hypothetical protein O3M35_003422 [Rhynocoris fuscipes]|uniref:Transmembrane protein n=1 Tax=Rhynocoris fuscipes TaxID=488301 RepID=A0AAW1CQR1_9HEMI
MYVSTRPLDFGVCMAITRGHRTSRTVKKEEKNKEKTMREDEDDEEEYGRGRGIIRKAKLRLAIIWFAFKLATLIPKQVASNGYGTL